MMSQIDFAQLAWTHCRDGVSISTIRTRQDAFETAICGADAIEVVENYDTADAAFAGHARYVKRHSGPLRGLRGALSRLLAARS